jgi:Family of unknown function (DUF5995)
LAGALLAGCSVAHEDAATTEAALYAGTCGLDPTQPASLRTLMLDPISTPEDADARFVCLSSMLRTQHDRRAPFATLYSSITSAVRAAIVAGRFEDGPWVRTYLASFAELYRVAFVGYIDGGEVPAAWRIAFDTAHARKELVVQDLSLGVNAHVDRDLSHALVRAAIGAAGPVRDRRRHDHFAVNDVLHEQLDAAVTTIAEEFAPGLGKAPGELRALLEAAYFDALVVGRQKAWDDAVLLTDSPSFGRFLVSEEIELSSEALAKAILLPNLDPALFAALKALEGSS